MSEYSDEGFATVQDAIDNINWLRDLSNYDHRTPKEIRDQIYEMSCRPQAIYYDSRKRIMTMDEESAKLFKSYKIICVY